MVKHFFEEETRQKIVFLGHDFQPALLNAIDASELPIAYGGTCTCEELGGDCMKSDKGPWKDYEVVWPKGIVKKSQNSSEPEMAAPELLRSFSGVLDMSEELSPHFRSVPKTRTKLSPGVARAANT